ncbi:MAG: HK97 family phage prohead protease [Candidatus Binatia bacterium]
MTLTKPLTEFRSFTEIRKAERGLTGYAAKFGVEARIGNYVEVIKAGAFRETLSGGRDILALVDHDLTKVLARTRSGSLKLIEDTAGLQFDLSLPQTTAGRDVLELANRGDLGGMSFGFTVNGKDGEHWTDNRRELRSINLVEISVVSSWPAYPDTVVLARSKTPRLNLVRLYLETCNKWA